MSERGDMTVLHEPFMYDHHLHRKIRLFPHFKPEPDRPQSCDDIRAWILQEASKAPVFFKGMFYSVTHRLPHDPEFAPALDHAFLVRDPGRAIASFRKLDPDLPEEEIGYAAHEKLREELTRITRPAPPLIRTEDVKRDPRGRQVLGHAGPPPCPARLRLGERRSRGPGVRRRLARARARPAESSRRAGARASGAGGRGHSVS